MLATPEILCEAAQVAQLADDLPCWRDVPLYREFLGRSVDGLATHDLPAGFSRLPFMTRRDLRAGFPQNFLPAGQSLESLLAADRVELEYTSGTSQERLPVVFGRHWWNEQEARALRLNAFVARVLDEQPVARRATLTTPACNGLSCPAVWQSRAQRTFGPTLFVNLARIPFLLGAGEFERMARETADWAPQFLDVDPVHGAAFALHCERYGLRFPSLRFVLCSYEFVSAVHRRILERVFGVPVFNLYGSTETGHLLMENEAGEMKSSHDTAFLEIVNPDAHGVGELAVTTLSNVYMPLLRYRIGDLVAQHLSPYATRYVVHGRVRDALVAADGRRVTTWQVDQCFNGLSGVAHYQVRQSERGDCLLRFVPEGRGLAEAERQELVTRLASLLAQPISTQPVPHLLPADSGKFRLTFRRVANEATARDAADAFPPVLRS